MESDFAFLVPQMIYLLDRNQNFPHSVNKSEIHPALSEIAKFISLSIYTHGKKLRNTHFFQIDFHMDFNNGKAVDKTRKIILSL